MGKDDRASDREEKRKMLAGELYRPADSVLTDDRRRARELLGDYNASRPVDVEWRRALIARLFGGVGGGAEIEPPFHCDYGYNIFAGERLFMNFGCVVLDCAKVEIGDRVLIGPGVHIYAAAHPLDPSLRCDGLELAKPVRIGNDVWIGGHAVVCPGVQIGDNVVIGAGSVVTRDVPPGVIAAGNPCRVLRAVPAAPG